MGTRRRFTPEYRRDVASLVLDTGSSIASVARDLGLGESVVGRWVKLERERRQAAVQYLMDHGIWQKILDNWGVKDAALTTTELNPAVKVFHSS